jgi:hypothetical protein
MMAGKLQIETIAPVQVADFSPVMKILQHFLPHFSATSSWFLAGCGIIMV